MHPMARLLAALGVAGCLLSPAMVPVVADDGVTKPYISVPGDTGRSLTESAAPQYSMGGAPFAVTSGNINVSISDQSGRTVNGVIRFKDATFNGNYVGSAVPIC